MRRIGPPRFGKRPPVVAKVRRTATDAYGPDWRVISAAVRKRDGHRCRICGSDQYIQVDHIIPIAKGGLTIMSNLWCLCDICHSKRPGHACAKHLILHKRNQKEKRSETKRF